MSVLIGICASCGLTPSQTKTSKWITARSEQDRIFLQLVTLTDKRPAGATVDNRDSVAFVDYYTARLRVHEFGNYYIADSVRYFQLYKVVPSLFKERIAIGGRYKTDGKGNITEFEELYTTPKLKPEVFEETANELFLEMVNKGNVDAYLKQKAMIEFPDANCHYNKETRSWIYSH